MIDWTCCAPQLDALFDVSAPAAFVFYRPWSPGSRAKVDAFEKVFGASTVQLRPIQFVTFSQGKNIAKRALQLASELGQSAGVWLLGSCTDRLLLDQCLRKTELFSDDTLFIGAECAACLGAALALDEAGRSTLFARVSSETEAFIKSILDALEQVARMEPI